jgi:hypothetical protein
MSTINVVRRRRHRREDGLIIFSEVRPFLHLKDEQVGNGFAPFYL